MKIDSNVPPSHLMQKKDAAAKTKQQAEVAATHKANAEHTKQAKLKMLQWFSRAGIAIGHKSAIEQDLHKKVNRHQFVKAQRKLKNLERIFALATDFSQEQAVQDELDPDWFFSFSEMAENINSPAMQELWAKIFTVEISVPGSFSLKTLQTLKNLTHRDAKILKLAVGMATRRKGEHGLKIIYGYHRKPSILSVFRLTKNEQINLAEHGLAYPDLLSLMDLGLIYNSEIETSELETQSRLQYRCGGETFHLAPKKRGLSLQYYKFTSIGSELARLINSTVNQHYLDNLLILLASEFELN
ncbi:TIGR03899 family protein [Aliiglaciecola sp. 3_MG-2023]|uniref:TIGR03899 family protein n=1 Tax=Aliiglaciecola sp. 3_MG-2023 TaxID=3062644 RepID=UPI0026E1715C|nr:TIGR03899 family protein [Aliiglaciecola sp. 3_MG-2023]MDO6692140.1 TIGR03899 family protein [Aliiglaciecola sp. 3_MG-2023]